MLEMKELEERINARFDKLEQSFADYCQTQNERLEVGAKKMARHEAEIEALKCRDNIQNGHAKQNNITTGERIGRVEKEVSELRKWIMGQLAAIILLGGGALLAYILK